MGPAAVRNGRAPRALGFLGLLDDRVHLAVAVLPLLAVLQPFGVLGRLGGLVVGAGLDDGRDGDRHGATGDPVEERRDGGELAVASDDDSHGATESMAATCARRWRDDTPDGAMAEA